MENADSKPSVTPMPRSASVLGSSCLKRIPNIALDRLDEFVGKTLNSKYALRIGGVDSSAYTTTGKIRKRKCETTRSPYVSRSSKERKVGTSSSKLWRTRNVVASRDLKKGRDVAADSADLSECLVVDSEGIAQLSKVLANKSPGVNDEGLILEHAKERSSSKRVGRKPRCKIVGNNSENGSSVSYPERATLANGVMNAKLKISSSPQVSNIANRCESSAEVQQSVPEQRVLRPRRPLQLNTSVTRHPRPLQDVKLCPADVERILGRRIKVFWPLDEKWYYGRVRQYDSSLRLHRVEYDDHDEEWLALEKEKFKLQVFPGEVFGHSDSVGFESSKIIEETGCCKESQGTSKEVLGSAENLKRGSEGAWYSERIGSVGSVSCLNFGDRNAIEVDENSDHNAETESSSFDTGIRCIQANSSVPTETSGCSKDVEGTIEQSSVLAVDQNQCSGRAMGGIQEVGTVAVRYMGDKTSHNASNSPGEGFGSGGQLQKASIPSVTALSKSSACVYVRRHNRTSPLYSIKHKENGQCNSSSAGRLVSFREVDTTKIEDKAQVAVDNKLQSETFPKRRVDAESVWSSLSDPLRECQLFSRHCVAIETCLLGGHIIFSTSPTNQAGKSTCSSPLDSGDEQMHLKWSVGSPGCDKLAADANIGQMYPVESSTLEAVLGDVSPASETCATEERKLQIPVSITSQALLGLPGLDGGCSLTEKDTGHYQHVDAKPVLDLGVHGTNTLVSAVDDCLTLATLENEKAFFSEIMTWPLSKPRHNLKKWSFLDTLPKAFFSLLDFLYSQTPGLSLFVRQILFLMRREGLFDGSLSDGRNFFNGSVENIVEVAGLFLTLLASLPYFDWRSSRQVVMQRLKDALFRNDQGLRKFNGLFLGFKGGNENLLQNPNILANLISQKMLGVQICSFFKPSVWSNVPSNGIFCLGMQWGSSLYITNGLVDGSFSSPGLQLKSLVSQSRSSALLCEVDFASETTICNAQRILDCFLRKSLQAGSAFLQDNGLKQSGLVEQFCAVPLTSESDGDLIIQDLCQGLLHVTTSGVSGANISEKLLKKNSTGFIRSDGSVMIDYLQCSRRHDNDFGNKLRFCASLLDFSSFFLGIRSRTSLDRRFHVPLQDKIQGAEKASKELIESLTGDGVRVLQDHEAIIEDAIVSIQMDKGMKRLRTGKSFDHSSVQFDEEDNLGREGSDIEHTGTVISHLPIAKRLKIEVDSKDCLPSSYSLSSDTEPHGVSLVIPFELGICCSSNQDLLHHACGSSEVQKDGNNLKDENFYSSKEGMVKNCATHFGGNKIAELEYYFNEKQLSDLDSSRSHTSKPFSSSKIDGNCLEFKLQANSGQLFDIEVRKMCLNQKMTSFYNGSVDHKKRKRDVLKSVFSDAHHLQSRRVVKRGRPSRQNKQERVSEQISLCCTANLLITDTDRGWRERGVNVEIQFINGNEWMIATKMPDGSLYTHKVQPNVPTGTTNRYTHAMIWKGGNGWSLEFSDRKQWNIFKGMYEECGHRNARAASFKHIPIPGVREIQDSGLKFQVPGFVCLPMRYICQTEPEIEAALTSSRVVYDMDSDDEEWLNYINTEKAGMEGGGIMKPWICEEFLEQVIDKLEKVSFMQHHEPVSVDQAVGVCKGLGSTDAIKCIYAHWHDKRQKKGMALVRYFQPAPWERYQKEIQEWQACSNEDQLHSPTSCKQQRPPMFAFCLRPRGLELTNKYKIQKQRSQRKLSSGCMTRHGASPSGDMFSDSHMIQPGSRVNSCSKSIEEASLDALPRDVANSSGEAQTCSSGGTGVSRLFEQPESLGHSFEWLRVDRQNVRIKKSCKKAKQIGTPNTESRRKQRMLRAQLMLAQPQVLHQGTDPDWLPMSKARSSLLTGKQVLRDIPIWQKRTWRSETLSSALGQQTSSSVDPSTNAHTLEAQANAAAARAAAAAKVEKSQRLFLKFDTALKKAVAALIEFEAIQAAEQAAGKPDSGSIANEQLEVLKQKVDLMSNKLSDTVGKGVFASASAEDTAVPFVDSWPVYCSDPNASNLLNEVKRADLKEVTLADAEVTLLPVASWSQELGAGLGTTLLQRVDKRDQGC